MPKGHQRQSARDEPNIIATCGPVTPSRGSKKKTPRAESRGHLMMKYVISFAIVVFSAGFSPAASPDKSTVRTALRKATTFMSGTIADHGGYAWVSSVDGQHSNGEGVAGPDRVWVQPPGTPAVALAFLDAYSATGDEVHLKAAEAAADALISGQLRSGGWGYSIEFDPAIRTTIPYRVEPQGSRDRIAPAPDPGGWEIWRKREFKTNMTLIDDDTTPAAIRFLMRLDQALMFEDQRVHETVTYALRSALGAQYPIGAWGHNYDRFPFDSPSKSHYPVIRATYPETWTRRSQNDFDGCYMLNDRITLNMIETMYWAGVTYRDDRYLKSAIRGGEFLLLAQLPDPQPAWAQQYDRHMHPVWDRKFEPPAITARESQDTLRTLIDLYRGTRDKRFLEPIPRALKYLRTCLREDGRLARFYELKTNKPLYFDSRYELTYDDRDVPDHYGFVWDSELDEIEKEYEKLVSGGDDVVEMMAPEPEEVIEILRAQTTAGAWPTKGFVRDLRGKKVTPAEGVIQSETFIENTKTLCKYLRAEK